MNSPTFGCRRAISFWVVLGLTVVSVGAAAPRTRTLEVGAPFPPFNAVDYTWQYYSLKNDFLGSPFLIYVFDPLSSQRISLIERQVRYLNQVAQENTKILGVAWGTTWGAVRDFARRNQLAFPVVFGETDISLKNVIADVSHSLPVLLVLDSSATFLISTSDVYLSVQLLREIRENQWEASALSRLYDAHQALFIDSQFQKALELVRVLRKTRPRSTTVQYLYAVALQRTGNTLEALRNILSIYDPENELLQDYISSKLLFTFDSENLPEIDKLKNHLLILKERPPSFQDDPWLLEQMAMLALYSLQLADAKQWIEQAYRQKVSTPGVRARRAIIYLVSGDEKTGIQEIEAIESKYPDDPRSVRALVARTFRDLYLVYRIMEREKRSSPSGFLYEVVRYGFITRNRRLINPVIEELMSRKDEYAQRLKKELKR